MTDPTAQPPGAGTPTPEAAADATVAPDSPVPTDPSVPVGAGVDAMPPPKRSKSWLGVLAAVVAVALLAGATAVLFVRVQEAQDRADEAVVLAGSQDDALDARLADIDATLASIQASGTATADDVSAARDQVSALRKCVNTALDVWSQATQAGKPVSITKC
jgi:hypothetical protein